jgi:hypothetical protein
MRVYLGPTDPRYFSVSFYEMTTKELHWLASVLRSARSDQDFGSDPKGMELIDRLDLAIRDQPKAIREAVWRPYRGPQASSGVERCS